jgi:hypothetical protein
MLPQTPPCVRVCVCVCLQLSDLLSLLLRRSLQLLDSLLHGDLSQILNVKAAVEGKCPIKHAMTQFLVFCDWGRAGLDGHTSDTLEK